MEVLIQIHEREGLQVVDSRDIASELDINHKNLLETIKSYQAQIEDTFGAVAFETRPLPNGGIPQKFVYLTEDQAFFIATLSRNSEQVVKFKARLVQAFQAARKVIQQLSPAEMKLQVFRMLEQEAETLREQNRLLTTVIHEQAPKVVYFDEVLQSKSDITTTLIAKELGMSALELNRKLKDMDVHYNQNGTWVLKAKYQSLGYTLSRTHTYTDGQGNSRTSILTTWTEKGRMFIHGLFKDKDLAKAS